MAEAGSVALARDVLRAEAVDLVVTDLKLPGESGLELLQWLKSAARSEAKTIVVSGLTDAQTRRQVAEAGAAAMLAKPCRDGELLKAVREALALG